MAHKLGFDKVGIDEKKLIAEVENLLAELQPDMTIFYRMLSDLPDTITGEGYIEYFRPSFYSHPSSSILRRLTEFFEKYRARMAYNKMSREDSRRMMKKANPRFILRNYLLHQAIEELQQGKDQLYRQLEEELKDPYSDQAGFFERRPEWAEKKAGCSMLSCSS